MNTWNALWPTLAIGASAAAICLACVWAKIVADTRTDAREHDGAERDGLPPGNEAGAEAEDPIVRAYIEGFKQGVRSERRQRLWTASASQVAAPDEVSNHNADWRIQT